MSSSESEEHAAEAEERWGGTEDRAESERREAAMVLDDWARAADEAKRLEADLADAMRRGVAPGGQEANAPAAWLKEIIDASALAHGVGPGLVTWERRAGRGSALALAAILGGSNARCPGDAMPPGHSTPPIGAPAPQEGPPCSATSPTGSPPPSTLCAARAA
ncbi:TipAS antibiotic-recognition domain-containing protein [Actinomyces timonensis]|uniref:TipAS antibiotic-recognition domain-containing protein n=1 Tax=Actinomyces timonensis TaxID=1288391 RepID=A0AAU8N5L1_9ACTO